MKTVLLGVTGSIAAYKACDIAHKLTKNGYRVFTIMTENACKFVTPLTFKTLTAQNVYTDMFAPFSSEVEHISLARNAALCLIAPATANIIAKMAYGIADDMLSTVILALHNVPIVVCPAMNTAMLENSATVENIQKLKARGILFLDSECGVLACKDTGKGVLCSVEKIVAFSQKILEETNGK